MYDVAIDEAGQVLTLTDKTNEQARRFHAIWLRDNAPDASTRDPKNGQKLIALKDIPKDLQIESAHVKEQYLAIKFKLEHQTFYYDIGWLSKHSYDGLERTKIERGWLPSHYTTWNGLLMDTVPSASFHDVTSSPEALYSWIGQLIQYGVAKLTDGPVEEEALLEVAKLYGYVRETNYGRYFDVRTEVNPQNLAFTNLGLQAHTDNPYRDPVPTMQILYCLSNSVAGGDSMVVDGFEAVKKLKAEKQEWFDVLANHCASFKYAGDKTVCLTARRPLIELAPDGELIGVRFNNRSIAAITDVSFNTMTLYYEAYRRLEEIINDASMEVIFKLKPGECFIVDNTRVLHARKKYSSSGVRWLQGCYTDKDAMFSKYHTLAHQL